MELAYYKKCPDGGNLIALVGVYISLWHITINNLAIVKSKHGGWFISMPSYKDKETQAWGKVIIFDREAQNSFNNAVHNAVEKYAQEHGEVVA